MTGQHDRQDERLTGLLPNQFGHCPLTGRYFEPCMSYFAHSLDRLHGRFLPRNSMQYLSRCSCNLYLYTAISDAMSQFNKKNRSKIASSFQQVRNPCDTAAVNCTKIALKSHLVYTCDFEVVT